MLLNSQQKQQYADEGFIVLNEFISADLCDLLIRRAKVLIQDFEPADHKTIFSTTKPQHFRDTYFLDSAYKVHFFFEEGAFDPEGNLIKEKLLSINKIGHALHDIDPVFDLFSRQPKLAQLVNDLGVPNPQLLQSMYICKQPFIGGEVNCHQDNAYLYMKEQPVVGLWFALEDATIENGCLWAIPGGHRTPLKMRNIRDGVTLRNVIYDGTPWEIENMQPLEVKQGSVIVLHGLLPHMSKENKSPKSRHAYSLHLISGDYDYAGDNWLQRPKEMPLRGF